ncbi:MAG: phosphonate metabolism protein/1,5-bisphosphokinase (PRPP-forming) PhnN [Rhodobacteraceae bacterium]|nr:phosphonate metabolism protein/1,5-bisphosphokinase (PRPP-forming) PhnN [Paracoccaceae bacterium]
MFLSSAASGVKVTALPDHPSKATQKLGPGRLILVVGPSGAGKDTLLAALRHELSGSDDIHFARRSVTRVSDHKSEDHDSITQEEYDDHVRRNDVALCWEAHGLGYIIPAVYDDAIRNGETVIANGSRRALGKAYDKYQTVAVLLITAPTEVLVERLLARGRETRAEIETRLKSVDLDVAGYETIIRIENTGTIEDGVRRIRSALDL